MADPLDIVLLASAEQTASSSGAAVDIGANRCCVKATLVVSAISGTGAKVEAILETAPSATGPWLRVGSFPALTVARSCDAVFADCRRWVKLRWVITGTAPAITFGAAGTAHQLYATLADINTHGIPDAAVSTVPIEERAQHALAATGEAEGYIGGGYPLPLLGWPDELRRQVAQIAVYNIIKRRGFQPDGEDALIVKGRDDAIAWLTRLSKGLIKPPGMAGSSPAPGTSGSRVRMQTGTTRGW